MDNQDLGNLFINPKTGRISITDLFGEHLANILAQKIVRIYKNFSVSEFIHDITQEVIGQKYTVRLDIIASNLRKYLPKEFAIALNILTDILGPENPKETGIFTDYYWIIPIGKFIEKYGLDNFTISMQAIEEITKRTTGEYAIRPFAQKYPDKTLELCKKWAQSKNFHLRRLSSEGLRPKLPWATKLEIWKNNPRPIFDILEILKEDKIKYVKKSVANHLRDWIKINPSEAQKIIDLWSRSQNLDTLWILKHAQR